MNMKTNTIKELIHTHYKSGELLNIARKQSSNEIDAEELLHVTIERVLDKEHLFTDRNFLGFFKTVMIRIKFNEKRDSTLHKEKDIIYTEMNIQHNDNLDNQLHYKMIFDDVSQIFDQKHTDVLFYKLNEYQSKEICELVDCQKNAIDGRFYRVRQRILKRYRNEIK